MADLLGKDTSRQAIVDLTGSLILDRKSPLDSLGELLKNCRCSPRQSRREPNMAKEKPDLVYGTLDMLILKSLQHDPRHGLAIADRIQQMSSDILRVEQGSLYPALYRLEAQGWIQAEWGLSENNRKARYYTLTAAGRKQLAAEKEHWSRITAGINLVLSKT
jgi:PadR family transcriptional regulator, regulatory protein PadR